ncbi:MAG: hypothetical protein D6719_05485 [Candidatus Dadabacteria bacterium]|nr:MAG: hypothetical protein D6719_05485 [Candidatus Dadabacteria bacterium]
MGFQELVSETEATAFAGVSSATLRRFVEAGYLQIEHDSDGLVLYSKPELEGLFGITETGVLDDYKTESIITDFDAVSLDLDQSQDGFLQQDSSGCSTTDRFDNGDNTDNQHTHKDVSEPRMRRQATIPQRTVEKITKLEREAVRLKNLVELQEKLLEMREDQIQRLKSEVDWMRKRVERSEEKSDRYQLLLLREAETIRGLVSQMNQKRPLLQRAFEFLGLLPPPAEKHHFGNVGEGTVEVESRPNGTSGSQYKKAGNI